MRDADYVGYALRHLSRHTDEHEYPAVAIGKYLLDSHNQRNKDLHEQFTILKKCHGKCPLSKKETNPLREDFNHMQRDFHTHS